MRTFPHLIVRHDIERVPVQGEGHVPEDGAAVLHHGHCLVQHSSLQRTVHSDLQRHRQIKRGRGSEGLAAGQWLNGCSAFGEWHLLSIEYQFVCFVRSILHLVASSHCPSKTLLFRKIFFKCHPWKTACFQFVYHPISLSYHRVC